MTALKKAVRTRRGVEPTGRPVRREVELGKKSTNELVQDVSGAERESGARAARSTVSRAKRIFGRARARARTLATATRCAARGLSRGGRAPYLGEGAARARRDDVNPVVFGVAR